MKILFALIRYDLYECARHAFAWITPLLFYVIVLCLFPFALGPSETALHSAAPGVIWVSTLLAVLLSIGQLFDRDNETGTIDLFLLSPYSLTMIVLSKMMSHWLMYCLPLILLSPLFALMLGLNQAEIIALMVTLLLGTPVLSMLGSIGAALTVGLRGHGLLLPILILPLYLPVLIVGIATVQAVNQPIGLSGYYAIMGAYILLCLTFSPLLGSVALRIGATQ